MLANRVMVFGWVMPLLLLGVMQLVPPGESVCCPSKVISFRMIDENDDCSMYDAESQSKGVCKVKVCEDGTAITGKYCGHGACNIFGCRCEGGCRRGDAVNRFIEFYGDYHISDVHFV